MPLITIRRDTGKVSDKVLNNLCALLPDVASSELSCEEGGQLANKHIMIEVNNFGSFDMTEKDIHIRILAHNYPSRVANKDKIRKSISDQIKPALPDGVRWYVWLILADTSYGSDTEEN